MKKLLAMVLCVMMFVSVISTAAFAENYNPNTQRVWKGESQSQKIVDALRTNIEVMYGSLAVDNAVYNSVKSIDKILGDLVDEMLKDYSTSPFNGAAGLTSSSDLNDAIMAGLRSTIGGSISEYLNKHSTEYYTYDTAGRLVFNPAKYAGVYAKAASEALTSKKAVAGIQAYMLYAAERSAFNSIANQANDLRNLIDSWGKWDDYGFGDSLASGSGATAGLNGIHLWNTPTYDIDGVLHNINAVYSPILTEGGQLGVNLDGMNGFGLGVEGLVPDVDGRLGISNSSDNETTVTPIVAEFILPDAE